MQLPPQPGEHPQGPLDDESIWRFGNIEEPVPDDFDGIVQYPLTNHANLLGDVQDEVIPMESQAGPAFEDIQTGPDADGRGFRVLPLVDPENPGQPTKFLQQMPNTKAFLDQIFKGGIEGIESSYLTAIDPGHGLLPHVDDDTRTRKQLPLITEPYRVRHVVDGMSVGLMPGSVYDLAVDRFHGVVNRHSKTRIQIVAVADMSPTIVDRSKADFGPAYLDPASATRLPTTSEAEVEQLAEQLGGMIIGTSDSAPDPATTELAGHSLFFRAALPTSVSTWHIISRVYNHAAEQHARQAQEWADKHSKMVSMIASRQ